MKAPESSYLIKKPSFRVGWVSYKEQTKWCMKGTWLLSTYKYIPESSPGKEVIQIQILGLIIGIKRNRK